MPITIKEILNSDAMSGFVEKVNFNFDQLVLAGGGPPGPIGTQGPDGPVGPQGKRGDHWFTGTTAFSQTTDHDGVSPLQVQDNYLDINGDVYNFFDNGLGITGWTYSGVNLKGVTGATGATGGGTEWQLYEYIQGQPTWSEYYGPSWNLTSGTVNLDFAIPTQIAKNAIFLGDAGWSYTYLHNFGKNFRDNTLGPRAVPKLTLIQSGINEGGFNGLQIGAYGLTTDPTSFADYDNRSTDTYAENFMNFSFYQKLLPSTLYQSWFGIHSLKAPLSINLGDPSYPGFPAYVPFELSAHNIDILSYEPDSYRARSIQLMADNYYNIAGAFINTIRAIELNTYSNIASGSMVDGLSKYGYVGLQTVEGSASVSAKSAGRYEHGYGTVIIGTTAGYQQGALIGVNTPQALQITRKISNFGTYDAGIRFSQDTILGPTAAGYWRATTASMVPVRISDSNLSGIQLNALVIGVGIGNTTMNGGRGDAWSSGRFGISNDALSAFKPQFPFHQRAYYDYGVRSGTAVDGSFAPNLDDGTGYGQMQWFAGFDFKNKSNAGLVGSALYNPKNDVGIGYIINQENWAGELFSAPGIQTYYTEDYDHLPQDGMGGRSQGIRAPHLFMQYGEEVESGNIGIGFRFDSLASSAYSKVHIEGGVVIGAALSGYHQFGVNRIKNGIILEKTLVQGAKTLELQFQTRFYGATALLGAIAGATTGHIPAISAYDPIIGRQFISRGTRISTLDTPDPGYDATLNKIPDYSGPDLRTGLVFGRGTGYLTSSTVIPNQSGTVGPTADSNFNAIWKTYGDYDTSYNSYGVFKVIDTFAMDSASYSFNTLPTEVTNIVQNAYTNYKRIWYIIPSSTSTVFLDLSEPKTNPPAFSVAGQLISLVGDYWFNYVNSPPPGTFGTSPNIWYDSSNAGNYSNAGFKVQDGNYEGQILRLMVTNVNSNNYAHIESNNLPSVNTGGVYDISSVTDNLCLSSEPLFQPGGVVGANVSHVDTTTGKKTWPMPYGMNYNVSTFSTLPLPNTLATNATNTTAGSVGNANAVKQNANNDAFSGIWTDIDVHNYNTQLLQGYGVFRILPWYSITLQWHFDSTLTVNGNSPGCWYEIARERLQPRQNRAYDTFNSSGSGSSTTPAGPSSGTGTTFGCCFLPGTQITLIDGTYINIENLVGQETVLSYNIETSTFEEGTVNRIFNPLHNDIRKITIGDTIIDCTSTHPFWSINKNEWASLNPEETMLNMNIPIVQLEIGDILLNEKNEEVVLTDIQIIESEDIVTYDISVSPNLTYFANSILVHNKGGFTACCFMPGTLITMADMTLKPIETLVIGEKVLSYNEETSSIVTNKIDIIFSPIRSTIFEYVLDNGTTLQSTADHPIFVINKGWSSLDPISSTKIYEIEVNLVEIGDSFIDIDGNPVVIENIIDMDITSTTHTLRLADESAPTFYANGVLSHNMPGGTYHDLICAV